MKPPYLFLSAVSKSMRMINMRQDEALIILGDQAGMPMASDTKTPWIGDYLNLSSKRGDIMIGYIGEDKKPEEGGLWKKITDMLFG